MRLRTFERQAACRMRICTTKSIRRAKNCFRRKANRINRLLKIMNAWKTVRRVHEGLPLFLRYPENLDIDLVRVKYPAVAIISHHLAKVTSNGAPEADYNDGL